MTTMNKRHLFAAGLAVAAFAGPQSVSAQELGNVLPAGWHADFGAPVAWDDSTLWFYADAFDRMGADLQPAPGSQFARNAVGVDGRFMRDVLPKSAAGTNFWITDAVELADGTLLVMAIEERDLLDQPPPWNFELVDTDAWIVRQPDNPVSWRFATKIDDGPWGDDAVYFSDQWPGLAFVKDPFSHQTEAVLYDPADPTAAWRPMATDLPESGGVFAPVQTADGWLGVVWGLAPEPDMWHVVETWRADTLEGEWSLQSTERTELRTHDHQLNVVDGVVVHRSNNLDGSRRPEYEVVTEG